MSQAQVALTQEELETAWKHSALNVQGLSIWFKRHSVLLLCDAYPVTHLQEPVVSHMELFTALSH